MNSTHAHFNLSACKIGAKLKPHGSVCQPFWILCLFWWRHRFQIASFSPSALETSVFKKHRFQIAPLWRAFSNGSFLGDRFRRCSVDDSRIRSKTAPFSFEIGLVWTGPKLQYLERKPHQWKKDVNNLPAAFDTRLWNERKIRPEQVSYLHLSFIGSKAFVTQIIYILQATPALRPPHTSRFFCPPTKNLDLSASVQWIQANLRQNRGLSGDIWQC